jgi:predicted DNA-binding transcriptional regulator AlpA
MVDKSDFSCGLGRLQTLFCPYKATHVGDRNMNALTHRGAFGVSEFCEWSGISRSKLYEEVKAGRIPMRKIGGKSVITMPDALRWLETLPLANASGEHTVAA